VYQQKGEETHVSLRFCQQGRRWRNRIIVSRFILQRLCDHQLHRVQSRMKESIKIGTRASKLALWQAEWVKSALTEAYPNQPIELVTIKTKGDKILDVPLAKVGGKGLFVKEIEQALLDGWIDIAVHSMKDMPAKIPDGLCIGAIPVREIPAREDPADVLISKNGIYFSKLKQGSTIGTSSLRRGAQIRHGRPDIIIVPLRGNVETRLRKLQTEKMEAVVLAAAGIKRLNLAHRITEYLNFDVLLPAVGQGALSIEIRQNDPDIQPMIKSLDDPHTRTIVMGERAFLNYLGAIVMGERAFLNYLGGSCQVPIAGHGMITDNTFRLTGLVADLDGSRILKATLAGPADSTETIGISLAQQLLDQGADKILEQLQTMESANHGS
jgi:hydroxymethylbilane synthase